MIRSDFTAMACRKAETSSQLAVMLANASAFSLVLFLLLFSIYSTSLADLSSSSSADLSFFLLHPLLVNALGKNLEEVFR